MTGLDATIARARRACRYAGRWASWRLGLSRPGIVYIIDNFRWALGEVGALYQREVRRAGGRPFLLTDEPRAHYGKVVHFASQFFLNGGRHLSTSRSDRLVFNWYHGDPSDPDPSMRECFRLLPWAAERVDRAVASCVEGRDRLLAHGWPADKIALVPLGVDTAHFRPPSSDERRARRAELGIPDGAFAVGSFQKDGTGWGDGSDPKLVKGPDVWCDALERVHRERSAFAVLLGPARGYVKARLEAAGIPYAHRRVERMADTAPYYDGLDAYLIASRSEGGPLALLESMAKAIPVVSTRMGMPADLLSDGQCGKLAEVGDAAKLAEHVLTLAADPAAATKAGVIGRERVMALDWEPITRRMLAEVWEPLLAGLST